VFEAVQVWRRHPREIASDLSRFHRRRIAEWHYGDMLSYELLELCEFMDADGAYKTAAREGEWSELASAVFQTASDTAVLRAGMVPGADGDTWGSHLFIPLHLLRGMAERAEEAGSARASIFAMADISRQQDAAV
jgi:hypothetical protein